MTNRHSRQGFLGTDSELKIQSATVAVIGLCGGGSHVSQQLAHIGVGNILLVDPDHADDTNINRMVGLTQHEAAEESPKAQVIGEKLRLINPAANIVAIPKQWQEVPDALKTCAAIFGCVDSISAREQLERFSRRYGIPYIDVGMDVHGADGRYFVTGQVIASLPHRPCMRCMGFITDENLAAEEARYGAAGGRAQVVWPNGVWPRRRSAFSWLCTLHGIPTSTLRSTPNTTATETSLHRAIGFNTCEAPNASTLLAQNALEIFSDS